VFSVSDSLTLEDGASIFLDKEVYGLGEKVTLSGLLPPIGESAVSISLTKPDGSIINSGATLDNQRFSWSWMTPIVESQTPLKLDDRSLALPPQLEQIFSLRCQKILQMILLLFLQ
jgi:hypothetical protein